MGLPNITAKFRRLTANSGWKRYAGNLSWVLAEKVLRMFLGLFVGIWVARYLGPAQFGLLSYAQSFVFLFAAISTLGLDSVLVRELVKDSGRRDELMGSAFGLRLIGAIIVLPMLAVATNISGNDSQTNLIIFLIASSTILQSFNVIDLYFQSKVLSKYVAIMNSLSLGLSSVFKIILILNDAPLVAFASVMILDTVILVIGLVYVYLKKREVISVVGRDFSFLGWSFNLRVARNLLTDSWPLIFAGLAVSVYMRIDQVMLKQMVDVEAVGNYAAALRLSEAWYFIPMAIVSSVFPAIVNSKKHSNALYLKRLQDLYTLMVWMAIAVAGLVSFLSDWLVVSLYGESYSQASGVLMVHIWTGVFVFLGVAFSAFLTAENFTLKALYRSILGAIINISANYVLIPHYGILGAAMGTLVGNVCANVIYDVFDKSLSPHLHLKLKAFFPMYLIR